VQRNAFSFERLLVALAEGNVDFILVGGVCAILHGAPLLTTDVDIVPSRAADNLQRLEHVLRSLGAYYREHPPGRIVPEAARMGGPGHHLLMTTMGPVDVLGMVGGGRDYAALLPHSMEVAIGDGSQIRILDLPTLILTKQEAGRDKDRLVLPILRRTLEEIERQSKA
jgi:hypothetical protein